jgi:hypothetical protein
MDLIGYEKASFRVHGQSLQVASDSRRTGTHERSSTKKSAETVQKQEAE